MVFVDRIDAGRRLGAALLDAHKPENAIVYGVPRGGVILAREIAKIIQGEHDVAVTRKIGAPMNPELAIGAVAEDGVVVLDESLVERLRVPAPYIEAEVERQTVEVRRRLEAYRSGRAGSSPEGRTCVLVDDGIATGSTVKAALSALRRRGAARVILAVPVASEEGLALASKEADDIVCLQTPHDFIAVGQWYEEFSQVTDEEVVRALKT